MYLCDGYSTIVQAYDSPNVGELITYLRARSVKLPGMNGGPPIDTHTMLNQQLITKAAQGLVEYDDMTMQCQYDIAAYIHVADFLVNRNKWYKVSLPDNSIFGFWGCMYKFDPAELRKGEFPLAEVTIGLLNRRGDSGEETGPNVTTFNRGSLVWPPETRPRGVLDRP
jgi:hypothetical protein